MTPIDRDGDGPPLRRDEAKAPAQRPDDLRATAFTDDVFDDDYYGRRRGRGVSFGLIAGIVFGAAVAAVAGWYVFGTREAAVVDGMAKNGVVKADPDPYKVKPEDPGGLQVENQDKLVYERLDKSAKPGERVENLLPEPEQPKAPPLKKPDATPDAPAQPGQPAQPSATGGDDPLAKLVAKVEGVKEAPPAAPPAAAPVPKAETQVAAADKPASPAAPVMTPASPTPADKPAAPASSAGEPLQLGPKAPAAAAPQADTAPSPAPAPQAAPAPKVASAPPVAAPTEAAPGITTPAAPAGAMFLQLASARSEDAAMGEWKRINGKNSDVLAGLSPSVVQADLGEKGIYFRLRAGPVADKTTAEGLCASLMSRNVGCIVVKP